MNKAMLLLLALVASTAAVEHRVNPIRKVVTMLQMMENKVTAEGEAEEKLFDKFMCYCNGGLATLQAGIEAGNTKATELAAAIEKGTAEKAQLDADLKAHREDRTAAETAMAEASALREKEAGAYAKASGDLKTNLAGLAKATAAIEKGMGASFLQTETGLVKAIKNLAMNNNMADVDRQDLLSFLSNQQNQGYAPQSGQITGILKTMSDEMTQDLSDADAAEAAGIASTNELMAAKKKQVESLTAMIESKSVRIGDLGVELAMQKNDLEDTQEAAADDAAFVKDMEKSCKTKQAEWDERVALRNEELLALADTIKMLNDDDALELFKKTLASSASFVQIQTTAASVRAKALNIIKQSQKKNKSLDFIALALSGKKVGFGKVLKMIDSMTVTLKNEQEDDDLKKAYCEKKFDESEDTQKQLVNKISDLETAITDAKEGIETAASEIAALEAGVVALDKSVAEATENRKEENEDYKALMAGNGAAADLIAFAKNRMQKFYNPKMYKAPPKRELSEEERITLNMGGTLAPTAAPGGIAGTGIGFVQISAHKSVVAPPPPPEADLSSKPKTEEAGGVMAMMDMMVADLDKEMQVAEIDEKNAQEEYEQMMTDSADKRAEDSKSVTDKASSKAELTAALEQHGEDLKSTKVENMENDKYIGALHGECDWNLKYYDARKAARVGEIDSLGKAKAVLSGADFSLLQTRALRR